MKTPEEIAQWVVDNRYPQNEKQKVSDAEMYHNLVDSIANLCNLSVVTNRTCVTCLYCQINPTSEFIYDRHKCTLAKPFVSITDATKFVCDDWTEITF